MSDLQNIVGSSWLLAPFHWCAHPFTVPTALDTTLNAVDEATHFIGTLFLPGRTGSKTISAAGSGKIHWLPGASITFANASTNLRVGIQDVDTGGKPARGDGTFDVYADLVGGTDTITAHTFRSTTMETGTKTIAHGDKIAIVFDLTGFGGADSVLVRAASVGTLAATGVTLETSGPTYTAQASLPIAVIEFDDGTFGWLDGSWVTSTSSGSALTSSNTVQTGSTPDEYCNVFRFDSEVAIDGLWCLAGSTVDATDFELVLYSDPLGAPSEIEAITVDGNQLQSGSTRVFILPLATIRTLAAGTVYAVAIKPTTANSMTISQFSVAAAGHLGALPLGADCYMATRSDETGAFSATTTARIFAGVRICGLHDGTAGAGGESGGLVRFNAAFS
jgi:hypothetical protein